MLNANNSTIILSLDAGMYGNRYRYLMDQDGNVYKTTGYDSQHGGQSTDYRHAQAVTWDQVPVDAWTSYEAYLEDRRRSVLAALEQELAYLVRLRKGVLEGRTLAHYRARRLNYFARKRAVTGGRAGA